MRFHILYFIILDLRLTILALSGELFFMPFTTATTPYSPILSQNTKPVATSRRRIRSFLWNLAKIAVPLHRQSEQTTSGRHDKNIKFNNLKFIRL